MMTIMIIINQGVLPAPLGTHSDLEKTPRPLFPCTPLPLSPSLSSSLHPCLTDRPEPRPGRKEPWIILPSPLLFISHRPSLSLTLLHPPFLHPPLLSGVFLKLPHISWWYIAAYANGGRVVGDSEKLTSFFFFSRRPQKRPK